MGQFCVVADRGMISSETLKELDQRKVPYILGARMRRVKEIREEVLSRGGRFREVRPEGESSQDPSPLQVKEVWVKDRRYVVCLNPREARKDEQDRQILIEALKEKLKRDPKALIGNRGYRKYLKIDRDHIQIDPKKVEEDARFDGKWVLQTTADLPTDRVALKYKELWQVEQVFRDMKSILVTRPIYHQVDETIRGHVFCSFLALVLCAGNWTGAWIRRGIVSNGRISSRILNPCRKLLSKKMGSVWPFAASLGASAERFFRQSGLLSPRRFGRCNRLCIFISKVNLWCQGLFDWTYVFVIPKLYFYNC